MDFAVEFEKDIAPIFFHYVNVGPNLKEREMVTDVYLPLQ